MSNKVRPAGFERVTFGSVVTGSRTKDFGVFAVNALILAPPDMFAMAASSLHYSLRICGSLFQLGSKP